MNEIAKRLNAYITVHPFDSGDSDCETVLDQLYQAYAESHESDPPEIRNGLRNWTTFWAACLWKIIMPYGISVANSAPPMNIKPLWMVSNTART